MRDFSESLTVPQPSIIIIIINQNEKLLFWVGMTKIKEPYWPIYVYHNAGDTTKNILKLQEW